MTATLAAILISKELLPSFQLSVQTALKLRLCWEIGVFGCYMKLLGVGTKTTVKIFDRIRQNVPEKTLFSGNEMSNKEGIDGSFSHCLP